MASPAFKRGDLVRYENEPEACYRTRNVQTVPNGSYYDLILVKVTCKAPLSLPLVPENLLRPLVAKRWDEEVI